MAELKPLLVRSNWPGLGHLGAFLLVLVGTGSLVIASMGTYWLVPAMFMHGVVLVHLFALQHECSHYTVFAHRTLCEVLGRICGFVLCVPHQFFRHEHMKHHTHTQIEGEDPELIPLPKTLWGYLLYVSAIPYWYRQIEGVVRRALGELTDEEKGFLRESVRGAIERESQHHLIGYGLSIASMLVFGSTAPIYLWLLPALLGEPVMRAIRMAEHVGKPLVPDMLQNTRTTNVSWPMRFLCWNMNYHIEHHYAPAVPYHALPALHAMLGKHVVPAQGYFGANRDILRHIKAASIVSA
jgi:fatty acid desaturase